MRHPVIAVIPARGGSDRIPRKNLCALAGKPLLAHPIETARASGVFDEIIVSSDDAEILTVAEAYGALAHERPPALAGGRVFVIDVIKETIKSRGFSPETVIGILLATSPLCLPEDVLGAFNLFCEHRQNAPVVSVSHYEVPIQLAQTINAAGRLMPLFPEQYARSTRSTDHEDAVRFNEAIIFNTAERLLAQTNLIGVEPIPFLMPQERSVSIDVAYQLELVRALMAQR